MEIRTLRPDERESLLDLLDGWELPDGWRGRDFFRRYVERDHTFVDENVWVAAEHGRLLACVQIFPRRLRVLGQPVPTGGIGSVFTAPEARGAGLSTKLLERSVGAMGARGMELSLLFAERIAFYEARGWRSWRRDQTLLTSSGDASPPPGVELDDLDAERDLPTIAAIHSAYSAQRSGTAVRDEAAWRTSLGVAGNPAEEFRVARRAGSPVAYARAIALGGVLCISELGRLEDAADALAALLAGALSPRSPDPIAPGRAAAGRFRSLAVLPSFDDLSLTVALENRGVRSRPIEDRSAMLRCLDAGALAGRLSVSLLPGERDDAFLRRILPPEQLVSWPSDRF
jgi:GNAT superfamily N-acetyltransferase